MSRKLGFDRECVARPPSAKVAIRNEQVYARWKRESCSLSDLAEEFDLSPQQIGRILAARSPELDEDTDRSLYRGYLWRLFDEVKDLYREPGFKMSPTGRPAEDPDGNPAEDTNIKLQAAELELKVLESLRKLDARDKPQQQSLKVTHELAVQQASASMEEIRAKRAAEIEALRRAGVIQGTIEPPAIEGTGS